MSHRHDDINQNEKHITQRTKPGHCLVDSGGGNFLDTGAPGCQFGKVLPKG